MPRHPFCLLVLGASLTSISPAWPAGELPGIDATSPTGSSGAGALLESDQGACGGEGTAPCPSPDQKDIKVQQSAATGGKVKSGPSGVLGVGTRAPGFTLKDLKGKNLKFDPKGLRKPVLLVFWSLFCEPCKEELPLFGWLGEKYSGEGFQVLGVNLDGTTMAGAANRFFSMNKLSFPTAMDRKEGKRFVTAEAYAVTGTPSLFLVGSDGTIGWAHVGRVEASNLEAAVRTALGL